MNPVRDITNLRCCDAARTHRNLFFWGAFCNERSGKTKRVALQRPLKVPVTPLRVYSVDSISKPQASRRGSGMYLEFLLRRAHSRRRVERRY
jgi:hypothetical protein